MLLSDARHLAPLTLQGTKVWFAYKAIVIKWIMTRNPLPEDDSMAPNLCRTNNSDAHEHSSSGCRPRAHTKEQDLGTRRLALLANLDESADPVPRSLIGSICPLQQSPEIETWSVLSMGLGVQLPDFGKLRGHLPSTEVHKATVWAT